MRRRACLVLLALSACTPDYPFDRAGTWHVPEVPINDSNLRAMIDNPRDLVVGTSATRSLGAEASPPTQRLLTGQRYPLPTSGVIDFRLSGPTEQTPAGGGSAGQ